MASKEFSQRLKELRIKAGYTQKQVYEHFNIPQSTFSSWEVGKSEPSGEMLIKLCEYYKCDMMKEFEPSSNDMVTYNELQLLEKYRLISKHSPKGKESVDYILDREYELASEIAQKVEEDHIYTYTPRPLSFVAESHVPYEAVGVPALKASRNNHENEPGEQKKMQEDLELLKRPD